MLFRSWASAVLGGSFDLLGNPYKQFHLVALPILLYQVLSIYVAYEYMKRLELVEKCKKSNMYTGAPSDANAHQIDA